MCVSICICDLCTRLPSICGVSVFVCAMSEKCFCLRNERAMPSRRSQFVRLLVYVVVVLMVFIAHIVVPRVFPGGIFTTPHSSSVRHCGSKVFHSFISREVRSCTISCVKLFTLFSLRCRSVFLTIAIVFSSSHRLQCFIDTKRSH